MPFRHSAGDSWGREMRSVPSYGIRSSRTAANAGVRLTARTYGKARIGTFAEKASGHITVDSDAERMVSHILSVDPRVRSFKPQPFTVDLGRETLLFTREEVSEARKSRGSRTGEMEYTPDFGTLQIDGFQLVYEVKRQGYAGDQKYWAKVERAQEIITAHGYQFFTVVVPANERHPLIVNAQLLKPAIVRGRQHLTQYIIDRVEGYCESGPVLQQALCADLQISTGLIPPLLAAGVLQADIAHHQICSTLELSAGYGNLSHLCLIEGLQS